VVDRIDIYDANLNRIGEMDRIEAHLKGHWHRTFHCWIVSPQNDGQLLFQKRADTMKNFPGLLDVSAAGHLEAGESVIAGVREVTEELGIVLDPTKLRELGERVEVADQANGQRNREYQSVFMYRSDVPLESYKPASDEVAALVWLPISDGFRIFTGSDESLKLSGFTYEVSGGTAWEPFNMTVSRDAFLPRIQRYYLTALIMAGRLLKDETPLAIS